MKKFKCFLSSNRYPLILLILPFIVFWRDLLPVPERVFFGNDAILSFNTLASIIYQLREGIIPLWDPHTFFGIPLLTRPDSMVFYPPFGLLVLISTVFKISNQAIYLLMEVTTVFHFSLAGIGTYLFLRKINLSRFSAFIGGLIYMLNGGLIAFANTTALQVSMSLLPFVLITFDDLIRKPNLRRLSIFSLVFAMPVITFSWTSAITYHSMLLFYYFLFVFFSRDIKSFWKSGIYAFLGLIFAALISAVVVLPGLEVPLISNRATLNFTQSAFAGNLKPWQVFDFIIPYLTATNYGGTEVLHLYQGTLPYTYVGILTWLLIIPAFYKRRHKLQLFFFFLAVTVLLFSFGGDSPIFGIFYLLFFPVMRVFSEHRLALYIVQFGLAVTAAYGLENITVYYQEHKEKIIKYKEWLLGLFKLILLVTFIIFFRVDQFLWSLKQPENPPTPYFHGLNALVLFVLLFVFSLCCFYLLESSKRVFKVVVFLVLFFDLFLFAEKYPINLIGVDPTKLIPNHEVVKFITKDNNNGFYRSDVRALPHNYASGLFGINHIVGYLVYTNKITFSFYELMSLAPRNSLVDTLSALRYAVTETDMNSEGYKLAFTQEVNRTNFPYYFHLGVGGWEPVPLGTKIRVYENTSYFRYPILVDKVLSVNDDEARYLISSQKFNPQETALVFNQQSNLVFSDPSNLVSNLGDTGPSVASASESLLTIAERNTEKIYSANIRSTGFLVTSWPYYPDWKVQIDGVDREVIRTNLAFMGVTVPPGKHEIKFYYQPRAFFIGLTISALSLILSLVFIVLGRPPKEKNSKL
ncbi:MAG: YfhO family protein [Patescibacteria group bacterium]